MHYRASIKLFLKENYPYRKNAYRVFLIKCKNQNENQSLKCLGAITECKLSKALMSMDNDKSPENEGITKEFYIKF